MSRSPTTRWKTVAVGAALGAVALSMARRATRFDLRGKAALVTGGSRGLGLVLARELVRRGAEVVLLARDAAELNRARLDLMARGAVDVLTLTCDVTDPAQVQTAIAATLAAHGRIDVLVNGAGDIEVGPFASMRFADFERAMATNFWGPLHLVEAVLAPMRAQGGGRILNVSSIGGVVAPPHLLPYVASKFALTGVSLGLHAELAEEGIVVTTACPGLMRTGSSRRVLFKGDRSAEYAWFAVADSIPLLSSSAERAARAMVRAVEHGRPFVTVTAPARLAIVAQGLAPGAVARAMSLARRLLPHDEDERPGSPGSDDRPSKLPWWATALSDRAAIRNNESDANGATAPRG